MPTALSSPNVGRTTVERLLNGAWVLRQDGNTIALDADEAARLVDVLTGSCSKHLQGDRPTTASPSHARWRQFPKETIAAG